MNINKTIILLTSIMLLFTISHAQTLFSLGGYYYEPFPAQPGEKLDVWISFHNRGNDEIKNLTIKLEDNYPFTLYEGSREKNFGKIVPGEKVLYKYTVFVDTQAAQGSNNLRVSYKLRERESWKTLSIPLHVSSYRYHLDIESIEMERISPGDKGTVSISVKNNGDKIFRNVQLSLNLDELPIHTIGTVTTKTIPQLNPGEEKEVVFDVVTDVDAVDQVYSIPLSLAYQDQAQNSYLETFNFGIIVREEPKLKIILDDSGYFVRGRTEDFLVKIINLGKSRINFLEITLLDSAQYSILSSNYDYVGGIPSDDFEFSNFKIHTLNNGDVELKFLVEYRDQYNEEYIYQETITVPVYTQQELEMYEPSESNMAMYITIFILLAAFVFYYYKRKVKKK